MSCKDNINLRPAFINSFNNLYNYARLSSNINQELYKPSANVYGDTILDNQKGFISTITNSNINIDLENYSGNEDIIENKDNFFIIDNDNNNVYENCVITSGVPWYSTNNKFNKCEISTKIQLDDNNILKLSPDKKTINYNFKSKDKNSAFCSHSFNVNKAYCENSWYDWLIIPNFYLGNTYQKDIGKYTDNDVYKCYKPCDGDSIPFTNSKNEMMCIPKELYSGGLLMNKSKYCALGLINLIGNLTTIIRSNDNITNKNNLTYINYLLIFNYKHNKNIDSKIYKTNNIYNSILKSNKDANEFNIFRSNIIDIENQFLDTIRKEILELKDNFDEFDNSLNKNYNSLNIFSYKSTDFQELMNDLYTLNGLENNNILIDPILIHIWILANLYRPYEKDDLKEIAKTITTTTISNVELYDYLYKIGFTDDKTKNTNISIRLKNIFFRAVNVCYNNRTTFSANIINKTKKALQNKELINFIIDNGFYINPDNDNIKNKKRFDIFSSKDKLRAFLENLENLDNFTEIYYYNDVELSELVNDITGKNEIVKKIIGDFGMENNTDGQINGENNRFKYLFSIEYLEVSNVCKLNEIYNPVTGLCSKRPPKFEKIEVKEKDNIDSIDEQLKIPQMKYFITLFIQGVFVIIIGYIIYFFYSFFGETFYASINWITETYNNFNEDRQIGNLERHISATSGEYNSDEYKTQKEINKIEEDRLQRHIDHLKQKLDILITHENEEKITIKQKERKQEKKENDENQEKDE
jgi:hypothetical protein